MRPHLHSADFEWLTMGLLGDVMLKKPEELQQGAIGSLCWPIMSFSPDVPNCAQSAYQT